MRNWGQKKDDWQVAMIWSLTLSAPEEDLFLEFE
jgi:hypothetical protein